MVKTEKVQETQSSALEVKREAAEPEVEDWPEFAKWAEESRIPVAKKDEPVDSVEDYEDYDSMSGK